MYVVYLPEIKNYSQEKQVSRVQFYILETVTHFPCHAISDNAKSDITQFPGHTMADILVLLKVFFTFT